LDNIFLINSLNFNLVRIFCKRSNLIAEVVPPKLPYRKKKTTDQGAHGYARPLDREHGQTGCCASRPPSPAPPPTKPAPSHGASLPLRYNLAAGVCAYARRDHRVGGVWCRLARVRSHGCGGHHRLMTRPRIIGSVTAHFITVAHTGYIRSQSAGLHNN
jgi:hypothetical protein